MVTQVSERSDRMPGSVKAALVGVWIQAVFNLFGAGMPTAVVGMIIAVLIAKTMLGAPGREWFNR